MMNRTYQALLAGIFYLLFVASGFAQNAYAPDTPEPGSIEAIARDTTEPRFMSSWVAYVPDSSSVPSPNDFLGHIAGASGELVHTNQLYSYLRELDRTSPRVKIEQINFIFNILSFC